MPVTKEQIVAALRAVHDPELKRDIVSLNMVRQVELEGGRAVVQIKVPTRAGRYRERFRAEAEQGLRDLGVEAEVSIAIDLSGDESKPARDQPEQGNPLPDVKHVIAIGAGKGGVGKSTMAVNLAVGLARGGTRAGLLDGDIYGPSIPTMLGTDRFQPRTAGKMLLPFEVHGIRTMTIGALVEEDKPLIWRGPMAHGAFTQLATQTDWGELDYLIVDLPPGTGDVPLTLSQMLPLSGAVVICTPQKVAQDDARRAIEMFRQLNIEVLGLVENMSYFIGDDGKEYDIFGRGGAEMLAHQAGVPYLGGVPINTNLRRNADAGDPTANFTGDDQLGRELDAVTRALSEQVRLQSLEGEARPTLTIR